MRWWQVAADEREAYKRLDQFVARQMRENNTPGIAVAITDRERLLSVRSHGFANLTTKTPVTPGTVFPIGSISKAFAATSLLQLHEAGKVDLNAQPARYLPWLRINSSWAKPVYPIDWWLDSPNDRQLAAELEKTSEYKQKAAEIERLRAANPILSGFVKKYVNFYNDTKLGYAFWNGKEYETFATEAFRLSMQIYGDSPMNLHYQTRNQHMVDLVLAALKDKPVRRAIVLAGVLHKHYLDRAFRQNPNLSVAGFSALLPLKQARLSKGVRALLEEDNDLPYFERGCPRDLDQYFDEKLARLLHGPNMDAQPDSIPEGNLSKAEKILFRWQGRLPESARLQMNFAWHAFVSCNYEKAKRLYDELIRKFERGEMDKAVAIAAYLNLGRVYDLSGDRARALASYAHGRKLAEGTAQEEQMLRLIYEDKPYQRLV